MATKTFFSGKHTDDKYYTAIYSGNNGTGAQDLIANPLNRINEVLFHSNFAYLKSDTSLSGTVTFPSRAPTKNSSKKKVEQLKFQVMELQHTKLVQLIIHLQAFHQ